VKLHHAGVLGLLFFSGAASAAPGVPFKYYDTELIARAGQLGFTGFSDGVSIADNGKVAFIATLATGQGIYLSDNAGVAAPRLLTTGFMSANRSFGRALQLNETGSVAAVDRLTGAPPATLLRLWSESGQFTTYARGGLANAPFDAVFGFPSVNRHGAVAYSALRGAQTYLVSQTAPAAARAELPIQVGTPRPSLADNGAIVLKTGGLAASPITLWNATLNASVTIADATGFTELGVAPGISADGRVVAFYGDISSAAASAIGTHPGRGIFISIQGSGQQRTLRRIDSASIVAPGLPGDGTPCQPGLTCVSAGIATAANGARIDFSAYASSTRVAVIVQDFPAAPVVRRSITVAFMGTPDGGSAPANPFRGNSEGIFTARLDVLAGGAVRHARAIPVMQVGDTIAGRTITALGMNDALASASAGNDAAARAVQPGDHRLAFWTNSAQGAAIFRATLLDSDGDGLPDHWEERGIDFDGDGVADLALAGANRLRKDLYLELDYMQPGPAGGYDSKPLKLALQHVIDAFARAPVNNPLDQPAATTGISLHIDGADYLDEAIAFANELNNYSTPGDRNDIFDLKSGNGGAMCGAPGDMAVATFGTAAQRGANCSNVIGAKRLAYRYGVFIKNYRHVNGPTTSSGVASGLPGSYFAVSLGGFAPALQCVFPLPGERQDLARCGKRILEAGTFMHEFGHTLGLGHGGGDNVHCKPNYFSVMNYQFQFPRTVDPGRPLDYARADGATLDETALSESSAAGAGGDGRRKTAWSHNGGATIGPASGQTDWNGNGAVDAGTVAGNINRIPALGCNGTQSGNTLDAPADWSRLQYDLRLVAGNEDYGASLASAPPEPELTPANLAAANLALDSDGDGVSNAADNCPGTYNPDQADTGATGVGNACRPATGFAGDVNSDGLADCTDLFLVRRAFGKRAGEPGYDERADIDKDGKVDLLDLATQARFMPAGMKCS
jgi:hypothetical protein